MYYQSRSKIYDNDFKTAMMPTIFPTYTKNFFCPSLLLLPELDLLRINI
jgi:hypothetical protein